jgi:hypothetical protein
MLPCILLHARDAKMPPKHSSVNSINDVLELCKNLLKYKGVIWTLPMCNANINVTMPILKACPVNRIVPSIPEVTVSFNPFTF